MKLIALFLLCFTAWSQVTVPVADTTVVIRPGSITVTRGDIVTEYDPRVIIPPDPTVSILPGESIQEAVDANPEGTPFRIKAGIHREQQVIPKSGNTFTGETGSILSGARVLAPIKAGNYWVTSNQTQQGTAAGAEYCLPGFPRCAHPEDLFFDQKPLLHVASLSAVTAGKWFFDYGADQIYMADDPTGRLVEVSATRYAFAGSAAGVTIRGLIVEKYASPAQVGAIGDRPSGATNWTVDTCEIRWNHGVGLMSGGNGWKVLNTKIHHMGELGIGGTGDNMLIEGNEISWNLWAGYDERWEGGGTKWVQTRNLIVRNNHSHDNKGLGLWTDIDNIDTVYEDNVIEFNAGGGISHEISYAAKIRRNIVRLNGPAKCSWMWGGAIQIQNSQNVEVYENIVTVASTGCPNGIMVVQQQRIPPGRYGPYVGINNYIHHNTITHLGANGASGVAQDYATPNLFSASSNVRFDFNTYIVLSEFGNRWVWANSIRNFASFRQYGQEPNGTARRP